MNLTLHWRILVGAVAATMLAAFVLPPLFPAPDLKENRKLAPAPDFARLATLRADVDAYVADHFPARAQLIALFNYARMPLGVSGSPRVIVGKAGWLFYDDTSHLCAARGEPPLTDQEARAWLFNLAGRTESLKAQGVPYVIVTAPMKETIYPEFGPGWYAGPKPDRASLKLTSLAAQSGAGEVIHLYAPLLRAKQAGAAVYGPNDTHWSGAGAHAAYAVLMRRLQALGVGEAPRPLSDFQPIDERPRRDLAQMLGVGHLLPAGEVNLADAAAERRYKVTWLTARRHWTAPHVVDTGEVGKPTLLITIDSFSNALLPFLYSHFSRLIIAHNEDGAWREDLIDRFEPDVVILETIESGLRYSLIPAPPASAEAIARIDRVVPDPDPARGPPIRTGLVQAPAGDPTLRALAVAKPTLRCNLEVVELDPPGSLTVGGWIAPPGKGSAPSRGMVRLSGRSGDYVSPMRADRRRPDVAAALGNPAAEFSGFAEELALRDLPPGRYELAVYRRMGLGWVYCNAPRSIEVARSGGIVK